MLVCVSDLEPRYALKPDQPKTPIKKCSMDVGPNRFVRISTQKYDYTTIHITSF